MSGVTRKVKVWMKWTPRPNVGTVMLDDSQISSSATRVGVSIPEMGIKRGGSGWGYGEILVLLRLRFLMNIYVEPSRQKQNRRIWNTEDEYDQWLSTCEKAVKIILNKLVCLLLIGILLHYKEYKV